MRFLHSTFSQHFPADYPTLLYHLPLAPQIWLHLTIARVYKFYLYLLKSHDANSTKSASGQFEITAWPIPSLLHKFTWFASTSWPESGTDMITLVHAVRAVATPLPAFQIPWYRDYGSTLLYWHHAGSYAVQWTMTRDTAAGSAAAHLRPLLILHTLTSFVLVVLHYTASHNTISD